MNSLITILSFSIFLILFLWVGALAARVAENTDKDYLLGNRSFGRVFVGLSAGATGNSGWIMVGSVGMSYTLGVSALLMFLATFAGEVAFWLLFPDKINRLSQEQDSQTIPELLGCIVKTPRGKQIVTTTVAIITAVFVGTYTCAQFSAAAKTLDVFFGLDPKFGVAIAAASILVYCVTGGLRASVWTDVVQAVVVMLVCFGMLITVTVAGGGMAEIASQLHAIDPKLTHLTAGFTPWTLLAYLVGFFFFGLIFDLSQPQVAVRLLAGKNPHEVKQARWFYLGYVYSTWLSAMLFGIACRALIPNLSDPEQALPFYAMNHFSPWLVGVVLAGIFSVIASTADSQLLVCSSALARDLSPSFHRKMFGKYGLRYEQGMTLAVGIATAIATFAISSTVFSIVLFATGVLGGALGPAMFVAVVRKQTHYIPLCGAMLAGLATAIAWQMLGYSEVLYEIGPAFAVGVLVHEILRAQRKRWLHRDDR